MKVIISVVLLAASGGLLSWFYLLEDTPPPLRPEIGPAKLEKIELRAQSAEKDLARDAALAREVAAIRAKLN